MSTDITMRILVIMIAYLMKTLWAIASHLLPPVSMQPQRLQSSGFRLSPSVS
jgi:hypothetical protein